MKRTQFVLVYASLLLAFGCGRKQSGTPGALPSDWLAPSAQSQAPQEPAPLTPPSKEASQQVRAVFEAQNQGLDQFTKMDGIGDSFRLLHGGPGGEPGEAPWHLSNFVATFGVSVEGIFGKLISGGGAAVRGIWHREKTGHTLNSPDTYSVAWNTRTPRKTQLDPVVKMALKSGVIQEEARFRENLDKVAVRFDQIAQLLEIGGGVPSWQVSRFALVVEFDASGMISPAVSVGGKFKVRLDWDRPSTPQGPRRESLVARLAGLTEEQTQFLRLVHTLGSEIGAAEAETEPMKELGFKLNHIHMALGLTIEGSLGVVGLGGSMEGLLYFSRPGEGESFQLQEMEPVANISRREIPLLKTNLSALNDSDSVRMIDPDRFRSGMTRAIRMGRFFAEAAGSVKSQTWALDEVETEFEIGLGGNFGVVTVEGEAHVSIEFGNEGIEE